jgi:hypothetical protein
LDCTALEEEDDEEEEEEEERKKTSYHRRISLNIDKPPRNGLHCLLYFKNTANIYRKTLFLILLAVTLIHHHAVRQIIAIIIFFNAGFEFYPTLSILGENFMIFLSTNRHWPR